MLGRYEILERLGAGGMAEVWKARTIDEAGRERLVAIKRLAPELEHDRSVVAMFLDEARLAAQLVHPGIVGLEEVGKDEHGRAYMVLEYVDGHDLRWCLATAARARYWLPVELSLTVVRDLLRALAFAHDARDVDGEPLHVVHRDVSHSNVFIAKNGRVKLADFGIARARGRASQTRTGMVKGKIGYLSPEQVRAEALDGRSDVFSAAVVLWELLTQRRMFVGETDFKTMLAVCRDQRRPPSALRPGLPPEIDALVLKGVQVDREQRYASAEAFEDAITDVARALDLTLGPAITTGVLAYLGEVQDSGEGSQKPESQPLTVEIADPFSTPTPVPATTHAGAALLRMSAEDEPSDTFARVTADLDETTGGDAVGDGFADGDPTESGLLPSNVVLGPTALASGAARRASLASSPLLGLRIEVVRDGVPKRAHTFAELVGALLALDPGANDPVHVDGQPALGARELAHLLGLDLARAISAPGADDAWLPAAGLEMVGLLAEAALRGWSGQLLGARRATRGAVFSQGTLVGVASREPDEQLAVVLAAAAPDAARAPLARLVREVAVRRQPLVELAASVVGIAPEAVGGLHTGLELELMSELLRFEPQSVLQREAPSPIEPAQRPPLSGLVAATGLAWPEDVTEAALGPLMVRQVGLSPRAAPLAEALGSIRVIQPVLAAIRPGLTLGEVRAAAPPTQTAARVLLVLVGAGALRLR